MLGKTSNPVLKKEYVYAHDHVLDYGHTMTMSGTVGKIFLLLALMMGIATWIWYQFFTQDVLVISTPVLIGAALGGFLLAMVTTFKVHLAPITTPIYALLQGIVIGTISSLAEAQIPGIVIQVVLITVSILLGLLLLYAVGIIKVGNTFRSTVISATAGIALYYLLALFLGLFQIQLVPQTGLLGLGIGAICIIVASLNLVLDFDHIQQASQQGLPKYYEWYCAFGLMVTLIWLYLELLRFMKMLNDRR